MIKIILLITYIYISNITVLEPESLAKKLEGQEIKYSLSLFGNIDYLKSQKVELFFDKNNIYGCNNRYNKLTNSLRSDDKVNALLFKRGDCSFSQKSKNTEIIGGSMAFVFSEDDKIQISNRIAVSDNKC